MAIGGLDVGTSGCKFVLYDYSGNTLITASRSYAELGTGGLREIDPQIVWDAVKDVLKEVARATKEKIDGFAIASLGESVVPMASDGTILYRSFVTGDSRGIEQAKRLKASVGAERIMSITGSPPSEMYSLPKLMWMNENTDVFRKVKYLFLYEDFLIYMLTGNRMVSYSSAARTIAFDIMKKEWSEELLALAGVERGILSRPVEPGTVVGKLLPSVANELGLDENTVVVTGGHDQNCAALGGGVLSPDVMEDGLGTCEVLSVMLDKPETTGYMIENDLMCIPYVLPQKYLSYLVLPTCGILVNWFRDVFYPGLYAECKANGQNVFDELDAMAGPMPTDLLLLPQFGSSGMPHIDYDARGLFWGMNIHTTGVEMYRCVKESMAYHVYLAYETLLKTQDKPASLIRLTGGGASELTAQIRADVFNMQVDKLRNSESGTLGCAILTGTALKIYNSMTEAIQSAVKIGKSFYPDPRRREAYMERYEKYRKLYFLMRDFH